MAILKLYLVTAVLLLAGISQASTLTVCPHGCDYTSIQAAIDAASPGDVIEVHSGEYGEEVVLNKEVTLRGINTGGGIPSVGVMHLCGHPESSAKGFTFLVMDFGYPTYGMPEMIEKPKENKEQAKPSPTIWETRKKPVTSPATAAPEESKVYQESNKPKTSPEVIVPEEPKISQVISKPVTNPSEAAPEETKLSNVISQPTTTPSVVAPKESKISQEIGKPVTIPSEAAPKESKLSNVISQPTTTPSVVAPKESKISQEIGKPVTSPSEAAPEETRISNVISQPTTTPSVVAPKESKISQEIGKPVTSPATSAPKEETVSKMISKPFTSPGASVPEAVKNPKENGKPFTGPEAIIPKAPEFPTEVSKPSAGPAVAAPSYEKPGKLLYYEDFSYTQPVVYPSGYNREYVVTYGGRKLQISVPKADYIASFDPTKRTFFSDFVVEVEAVQEGGPKDSDYGVIFRKSDDSNYYRFRISSSGNYGFDKMQDGHLVELVPWTKSPDIHAEKETNLIKVECKGKKFTFGVNGVALGSCSDDSFDGGTFGLEVGSHSTGGAQVNFDNLKFYYLA